MNARIVNSGQAARPSAFTLVEVLAVIAIIGALLAILIPTANATRAAAARTRTKVQFNQWATAVENFRQEYGYYPTFDASGKINGGATNVANAVHPFHDTLAARRRDGTELPPSPSPVDLGSTLPEAQNFRRTAFISFADGEIFGSDASDPGSAFLIHDGFDGTDIAVLVDRNLDGRIDAVDYPTFPAVSPRDDLTVELRPGVNDLPLGGVRSGVIFYSAAPSARDASQLIVSWR